ncbi:LuxR C-terminal-related transcriptional regulator [Streptomyces sp. NPDC001250]|uniref:AAA family ATPase n=1 Tax=unclassified Streptomyces TaxID=2593676 RepID=UPI003333BB74
MVTLLERSAELGVLGSLIEQASGGECAVALIEGPAGVGKSALLAAAARQGHDRGLMVLQAHGCDLERGIAFGVVRQLLEPATVAAESQGSSSLLAGAAEAARAVFESSADQVWACTGSSDVPFAQLHGLYLLALRLAARRPLLVLVDDAHHADPCSRHWLTYLARRLRGSRTSLVIAVRTEDSDTEDSVVAELSAHPACRRLGPVPLSPAAVAQYLTDGLAAELDTEVAALCHLITGGNPYLLRALTENVSRSGISPVRSELPRLTALAQRLLPLHLPILLRRHSASVVPAAVAVATLGRTTSQPLLCEVTGLDAVAVAGALTVLEQAGLAEPGPPWQLRHPLMREALQLRTSTTARNELRARAADALLALGGDDREVADLLLATEPEGHPWRVRVLRAAAQQALHRHELQACRAYLHRALSEPPAQADRLEILAQLGITEVQTDPAAAVEHLRAAVEHLEPAGRVHLVPHLAEALTRTGRSAEAVALLDALAAEIPDADRESLYRLWAQGILLFLEDTPRLADDWIGRGGIGTDLPGDTPGQRLLLAALAVKTFLTGQCSETAATLAERALAQFSPPADPVLTGTFAVSALLNADRLTEAEHWYRHVAIAARDEQPPSPRSLLVSVHAKLAYRLGDPRAALAHIGQILDPAPADRRYWPYATALAVHALLDLGDVPEAARVCRAPFEGPVGKHWSWTALLAARSRLRLEQGRPEAALADLEECGHRQTEGGYDNPALVPWRSEAALIHDRLGHRATAAHLAQQELQLARAWGSPRTVATSLRALGLLSTGPAALAALTEAVALLESTPARIDLARALADLGELLAAHGHIDESRTRLRQALDLAETAHARPLSERAHRALLDTGARPRRKRQSGVSALTSRECRIATLAAEGMSNQQIATELFVTRRTVEFHLTRAFRKLGITTRNDLPRALSDIVQP